jgi:hypothetical protein
MTTTRSQGPRRRSRRREQKVHDNDGNDGADCDADERKRQGRMQRRRRIAKRTWGEEDKEDGWMDGWMVIRKGDVAEDGSCECTGAMAIRTMMPTATSAI